MIVLKVAELLPTPTVNPTDEDLRTRNVQLKRDLKIKTKELLYVQSLIQKLTMDDNSAFFTYEDTCISNERVKFYTGLPTIKRFETLYKFLDFGENGENLKQYNKSKSVPDEVSKASVSHDHQYITSPKGAHTKCILSPRDQLFLTLCRLRQGFPEDHLAHLFKVSQATVSRYCLSMINYMYLRLGGVNMWPSRAQVDKRMPLSFQDKFPKCRCIIDCTEIMCEVPQTLIDSTSMYSHYKGRVTLKGMLGIEPAGGNTFISQLYPGSTSDREIVLRSGFLNPALWTPGDVILADKGFTIQDLFQALGVVVNIPTFLSDRQQVETHEVVYTQQIATIVFMLKGQFKELSLFKF